MSEWNGEGSLKADLKLPLRVEIEVDGFSPTNEMHNVVDADGQHIVNTPYAEHAAIICEAVNASRDVGRGAHKLGRAIYGHLIDNPLPVTQRSVGVSINPQSCIDAVEAALREEKGDV